jgi:hypothetical protein
MDVLGVGQVALVARLEGRHDEQRGPGIASECRGPVDREQGRVRAIRSDHNVLVDAH